MRYFITGGCGFIGSHLIDRLADEAEIIIYDNLSSGRIEFVRRHIDAGKASLIKKDLLDLKSLKRAVRGSDAVFHLAANPDIRCGAASPEVDFEQGLIATHNLLEAMRHEGIKKIVFASSSTVFGEPAVRPTPENYGPSVPISIYGASKLACEGFITAYCHMFGMKCWIFRFANIVGKRGTHGILVDFIEKLKKDRRSLEILGNGRQRKSYLHVEDCADGIIFAFRKAEEQVNLFNLGTEDDIDVASIAKILAERIGLMDVRFRFTGGDRGWRGDVPVMLLETSKMRKLGWRPRYNSKEAVRKAVDELIKEKKAI